MNSKEALKYLLDNSEELYSEYEEDIKFYLDDKKLYNIVLKDLERLEQLEDNIKIHKETIKMQHNQIESLQSNLKCSQENEEAVLTILNLATDENEKLKNAIEILKEICSLNCDKTLETDRCFLRLTDEEYELLKGVFGND